MTTLSDEPWPIEGRSRSVTDSVALVQRASIFLRVKLNQNSGDFSPTDFDDISSSADGKQVDSRRITATRDEPNGDGASEESEYPLLSTESDPCTQGSETIFPSLQSRNIPIEERLIALQQLTQASADKQNNGTCYRIVNQVTATDAAIEYVQAYRVKLASMAADSTGSSTGETCQLCKSSHLRLVLLLPCCHYACAMCLMTGVNLVTASPPHAHVCASCQSFVETISFVSDEHNGTNWDKAVEQKDPSTQRKDAQDDENPAFVYLDNISWFVKYEDILEWLPNGGKDIVSDADIAAVAIHLPMDTSTGKIGNGCFVQCRDTNAAMRIVRERRNARLLDRPITVTLASLRSVAAEMFLMPTCTEGSADGHSISNALRRLPIVLKIGAPKLRNAVTVFDYAASVMQLAGLCGLTALAEDLLYVARELVTICASIDIADGPYRNCIGRLLLAISQCSLLTVDQRSSLLESFHQLRIGGTALRNQLGHN